MDSLPDELLLMIFERLPALEVCLWAAHVCKRWNRVARFRAALIRDARHFYRLNYYPKSVLALARLPGPQALFRTLPALADCLQELTIHYEMPVSDSDLQELQLLVHLKHLDVFTCSRVLNASFLPIAKRLNCLVINEIVAKGFLRDLADSTGLNAIHMFGRSLHYSRHDLQRLLTAKVNLLLELTLRCHELKDSYYKVISTCKNLKSLQLYSCWLMTRVGAMYLTCLEKLQCFHITGARMVRHKALLDMLYEFPQSVEELVLSSLWFSDEHAEVLHTRCQKLRVLEVWRCRGSADGYSNLVMSLQCLEHFDTDIILGSHNERRFSSHPTLLTVRCRLAPPSNRMWTPRPKFMAVEGAYMNAVTRGDGEGYRADLFYYWTQRVPLDTIPLCVESLWKPPLR